MLGKFKRFLKIGGVSACVWCILSEMISIDTVITGFFLGITSAGISSVLLSRPGSKPGNKKFLLKPLSFFRYIGILLKNIYKSGFGAIINIITEKVNVGIIEIETCLKNPINRAILANSITMTPGTVTIELEDNRITVLWLENKPVSKKEAGEIIKGDLENILSGSEINE